MRLLALILLAFLLPCSAFAQAEETAVEQCAALLHGQSESTYAESMKTCLKTTLYDSHTMAGKTPLKTVLVSAWVVGAPAERDAWKRLPVNRDELSKAILEALSSTKATTNGLNIRLSAGEGPIERSQPDVVDLVATITVREIASSVGKTAVQGSLSAVLSSEFMQKHSAYYDRAVRTAVPFQITTKQDTLEQIKEAVRILAPGLINCIKNGPNRDCDPERPWSMEDNR